MQFLVNLIQFMLFIIITFKDKKKRKEKTLATYREQPVFFEAVGHVSDAVYKSTEKGKHCVSK